MCPPGYHKIFGVIHSAGIKSPSRQDHINDCRLECDETRDCNAFEYGVHEHICKLHKSSHPNSYEYNDYILCSKGKYACPIGYTSLKGYATLESEIRSANYSTTLENCRRDCDRTKDCRSFQYNSNVPICNIFKGVPKLQTDASKSFGYLFCSRGDYK